jgi:hypothetical protein
MNGTTRDDGWSVAFIIITIVRDVMAAFSLCLERPLFTQSSEEVHHTFSHDVIQKTHVRITWAPMMTYFFFLKYKFYRFRDQLL